MRGLTPITVTYVYDSQSRRIAETVGSATTVYIYDGWNPIAEYSTTFALTKTYTWGMDLSGSMQGAGGVGGLLLITDHLALGTPSFFPTYDGNGNVSEYLDSTGTTVAHYEYDPFGKTTVATGSKAADFSHRFSTKPLDATTGLYYYGYRYYDPQTGRWPSRDPIEEEGCYYLSGFVGKDGVGRWELLGMKWKELKETIEIRGDQGEKVYLPLRYFNRSICKINPSISTTSMTDGQKELSLTFDFIDSAQFVSGTCISITIRVPTVYFPLHFKLNPTKVCFVVFCVLSTLINSHCVG